MRNPKNAEHYKNVKEAQEYSDKLSDHARRLSMFREALFRMKRGAERRRILLEYFDDRGVIVNSSGCINLKYDTDFQYLLKKGKLKRTTRRGYGIITNTVIRKV